MNTEVANIVKEFAFLMVGILLIVFRKKFAMFVMWYHQRRLQRLKRTKHKLQEYPQEVQSKAWLAANRFTEVISFIVGLFFIVGVVLVWLGIIKRAA
jgi:hypothetical protein